MIAVWPVTATPIVAWRATERRLVRWVAMPARIVSGTPTAMTVDRTPSQLRPS